MKGQNASPFVQRIYHHLLRISPFTHSNAFDISQLTFTLYMDFKDWGNETHFLAKSSLIEQVFTQTPYDLHLLLCAQPCDGRLNDGAYACLVYRNKTLVIHEGEEAHDELAVHAVSDTSMPGNALAEILDLEGSL